MLQTPPRNSKWKARLRLLTLSLPSSRADSLRTPEYDFHIPPLSSSRGTTPSSTPPQPTRDDEGLLTPLEVLDEREYFPLIEQEGVFLGGKSLPPPPPRKRSSKDSREWAPRGPKVKPFFTTQSPRTFLDGLCNFCFICGDTLETKLDTEKIVPLRCGDCVHGECLKLSAEVKLDHAISCGALNARSSTYDIEQQVLPTCGGKMCAAKGLRCSVDPVEEEVLLTITTDASLTLKLAGITPKPGQQPMFGAFLPTFTEDSIADEPSWMLDETKSSFKPLWSTPADTSQRTYLSSFSDVSRLEFPVPKRASQDSRALKAPSAQRESRYFVRESSILRPKPDRSSFNSILRPHSPTPSAMTVSVRINENEHFTLDKLRGVFIRHMLDNCPAFDLAALVSLGQLRLVDRLLVALDLGDFHACTVYLFANYFVVWNPQSPPKLLLLTGQCLMSAPKTSVLKFQLDAATLSLHSEIDSIIEKWGIMVSDLLLEVPSGIFTSSIPVSEIEKPQAIPLLANPWADDPFTERASRNAFSNYVTKKRPLPVLEHPEDFSPRNSIVPQEHSVNFSPRSSIVPQEHTLDFSPRSSIVPRVVSHYGYFYDEIMRIGLVGGSPTEPESRPVSPLRIRREVADDSDLDSDSDLELIREFTKCVSV